MHTLCPEAAVVFIFWMGSLALWSWGGAWWRWRKDEEEKEAKERAETIS